MHIYIYIYIYIYINRIGHEMIHKDWHKTWNNLMQNCEKWFYGILTMIDYCQIFFIHIYQIYMIWFGWILWHINYCCLFNAKSLYIYIKYIWFGLVGFYDISTIVGYLMLKPLNTYISNMYDLVWLGFMTYQLLLVI